MTVPRGCRSHLYGPWVAAGVALVAFAIYLATLAPGLTFEHHGTDGGDLIAAAQTLGIPHPTGYPTYTLLAWLFTRLPVGTIAYRVNLLSAVCAAVATGFVCRTAQTLLGTRKDALVLSAASAVGLASSPIFWSQAVISEVYALLALFASLQLWLLVRWRRLGGNHHLWLAGLLLGLGLGNHLTLLAIVPPALIFLWPKRRLWLRFRVLAPTTGLFLAGLCVYLYVPISASHHPAMNWGYPRTWDRFVWLVTARQYRHLVFGLPPEVVWDRLASWSLLLGKQFGWWGLAIALAGLWHWIRRDRSLAVFTVLWAFLITFYAFFYDTADSYLYLLPASLLMSIWWAEGAGYILTIVLPCRPRLRNAALALIVVLPLVSTVSHWREANLSDDWSAHIYAQGVLSAAGPHGLIVVRGDRPTFAAWYAAYAEGKRPDVAIVNGPLLAFIWYREHLRGLYPDLVLTEPDVPGITTDDLVRDLVRSNAALRPVHATDPADAWYEWFDLVPQGADLLYEFQTKPVPESAG